MWNNNNLIIKKSCIKYKSFSSSILFDLSLSLSNHSSIRVESRRSVVFCIWSSVPGSDSRVCCLNFENGSGNREGQSGRRLLGGSANRVRVVLGGVAREAPSSRNRGSDQGNRYGSTQQEIARVSHVGDLHPQAD